MQFCSLCWMCFFHRTWVILSSLYVFIHTCLCVRACVRACLCVCLCVGAYAVLFPVLNVLLSSHVSHSSALYTCLYIHVCVHTRLTHTRRAMHTHMIPSITHTLHAVVSACGGQTHKWLSRKYLYTHKYIHTHRIEKFTRTLHAVSSACWGHTNDVTSMGICIHTYTHTYTHTYMHTYAQDCIVHTYAACCVERMLTTKDGANLRVSKADLQPMLQPLLVSLFGCLTQEASKENPHIMKYVLCGPLSLHECTFVYCVHAVYAWFFVPVVSICAGFSIWLPDPVGVQGEPPHHEVRAGVPLLLHWCTFICCEHAWIFVPTYIHTHIHTYRTTKADTTDF